MMRVSSRPGAATGQFGFDGRPVKQRAELFDERAQAGMPHELAHY
ncbi:hypothetical protein [Paraburkholderia phenazinium]|jgi:hypothetical protein|nr:hypothetical protein [Paraburkholderia phenazinium]